MKYFYLLLTLMIIIPAAALSKPMIINGGCTFKEDVNLTINFNFQAESFRGAKKKFDDKVKQVEDFAKAQKIDKLDVQSSNFNINSQNSEANDSYQFSGSMVYKLASFDDGIKLGEFLSQQKFRVSLGANSYKNGNCGTAAD